MAEGPHLFLMQPAREMERCRTGGKRGAQHPGEVGWHLAWLWCLAALPSSLWLLSIFPGAHSFTFLLLGFFPPHLASMYWMTQAPRTLSPYDSHLTHFIISAPLADGSSLQMRKQRPLRMACWSPGPPHLCPGPGRLSCSQVEWRCRRHPLPDAHLCPVAGRHLRHTQGAPLGTALQCARQSQIQYWILFPMWKQATDPVSLLPLSPQSCPWGLP